MVCPPLEWSNEERGGYLIEPPRPYCDLIHNRTKSVPSQGALDALNKLQNQPYRINKFILNVQRQLVQRTHEIGCFRSYERDSWRDEHFPLYSSEYIASLEKGGEDYKRVDGELRDAYHRQALDEKEALTPHRILGIAKEVEDETFYTPWFFDKRLRMYPACALGVTGGDFVKALLVNARPVPINEDSKRELLIAIATSGAFDKVDKKDYFERYQWGLISSTAVSS